MTSLALTIEDEFAIAAVLNRYAAAADQRDRASLESCFTAGVSASYGPQIGDFDDRAGLIDGLMSMLGGCGATLHFITNVIAAGGTDGAKVRSYTQAIVHIAGLDAPIRTAGIYEDHFVKEDGTWRIDRRKYLPVA